jgi:Zn-dependent protease/CBS domain-containing protein
MPSGRGLRLGRVLGVEVRADWSLLVIVFLISFGLAGGLLPSWHPGWSGPLVWAVALSAAVAFFASILAHELAHAVVARRSGVGVPRITLFLFGGLAHMETEPPSWRAELRIALAGPLTSLLIGLFCVGFGLLLTGGTAGSRTIDAVRGASGLATVLLWLGPVNLMLAVFNMIPGFPLDGGRVLRAVVWGAQGDLRRATRWASLAGRAFAWLLISAGLAMAFGLRVPFFGRGALSGLWLILIGWFLNNAALVSYRQLLVREALREVPVARVMRTWLVRARPDMPAGTLLDEHAVASGQHSFPVEEDDGRFVGLVSLRAIQALGPAAWQGLRVEDVMVPAASLPAVAPQDAAATALDALGKPGVSQVPVVSGGRLFGLVRREDLLRFLALRAGRPAAAGR